MLKSASRRTGVRTRGKRAAAIAVVAALIPLAGGGIAQAAPQKAAKVEAKVQVDKQEVTVSVYSPSMDKVIPVTVLTPHDQSKARSVFYLLNGAGGGEDGATWNAKTKYKQYFKNKNVFVVTPIGGAFSYYTDWQKDDPKLGRSKWQTFLTKEPPPIIDANFKTTKVNAIGGISMAGTSVLNIAIAAPGLYKSVAGFSGCARTSDPLGQEYIKQVVEVRGGGDMTNMWGPLTGAGWRKNDPYLNAAKLRGTKIYLTTGSGLPGKRDGLHDQPKGNALVWADLLIVGGGIEAAANLCTHQMVDKLNQLKIPVNVDFRPTGTHSWAYWEGDLHRTWPKLAKDLGA